MLATGLVLIDHFVGMRSWNVHVSYKSGAIAFKFQAHTHWKIYFDKSLFCLSILECTCLV